MCLQIIIGGAILFFVGIVYLPPKVKHRWEVKFMVAQGWTLRQWFTYLARHNFVVDPIYWHRALFITVISTLTSFVWAPKEEKEYPEEVRCLIFLCGGGGKGESDGVHYNVGSLHPS